MTLPPCRSDCERTCQRCGRYQTPAPAGLSVAAWEELLAAATRLGRVGLLGELQEALVSAGAPSWIPATVGPPLRFDAHGGFEVADTDPPAPDTEPKP